MRAKKSLGQNFLKCAWVSKEMIKVADLKEGELVLEIGPGKGALTHFLLNSGARVLALEKDENLANQIGEKFKEFVDKGQLKIVKKDILDMSDTEIEKLKNYKLIANIPYYITGKILRKFLSQKNKPELIVFLVQKELAQRITSKESSKLSLSVLFYGTPKIIKKVPNSCFYPKPKVDSAILSISPSKNLPYSELATEFFEVIREAFKFKRKRLFNNLRGIFDEDELLNIFENKNINKNARPQDMGLDFYIFLAKLLKDKSLAQKDNS